MPNELSQITLPNNTTYDLKDSTARTTLNNKPGLIVASGTTTTYDGTTYTTGSYCEIFNNLTDNKAAGSFSHAEGYGTKALGYESHAEGYNTVAKSTQSHAEGHHALASNTAAHAEGSYTTASGQYSHAENYYAAASGNYSHAEGDHTTASGISSHAEGSSTIAASANQHAQGKYNVSDSSDTYAFIIGNGTADNARSNAFAIDWDGKVYPNNAATGIDISKLASEVPQTIGGTISIYDLDPGWWTRVSNLDNISDKPSDYSNGFICHVINTGLGSPNRKMIFFYPVSDGYTNIFYVATQTSSGWSSWAKYQNKEQTIASINGTGTSLVIGDDLNDMTALGPYNANTGTIASGLYNCPTTSPFHMDVKCANGSTRYIQEITTAPTAGDLKIFRRVYTVNGWQPWQQFADYEDLGTIIDSGPKNLVNPLAAIGYNSQTAYPYESSGLTFTLNADSSITVTNANTGSAAKVFKIPIKVGIGRSYTLSGCPSDGSNASYQLDIREAGTNTIVATDTGSGATFTASLSTYDVCIRIASGYTINKTFYIMVCDSNLYNYDSTFTTYIPTPLDLDAAINAKPALSDVFGMGTVLQPTAQAPLDMNNITDVGVYTCSTTYIGYLSNRPESKTGVNLYFEVRRLTTNRWMQTAYYQSNDANCFYIRWKTVNSWTSWSKFIDTDTVIRTSVYGIGANIQAANGNTKDLNNYTTPGRYYASNSAVDYISNKPLSGNTNGFQLTVECNGSSSRYIQTITYNATETGVLGTVYKRWYTVNGWSSWYKYEGVVVS